MKLALRWSHHGYQQKTHVETELDTQGHSTLRGLLAASECEALAEGSWEVDAHTIDLESIKQGFGALRRFRRGLRCARAALAGIEFESKKRSARECSPP
jgi:hypothetical protein